MNENAITSSRNTSSLQIRLPERLADQLREAAQRDAIGVSALVRQLLARGVAAQNIHAAR